MNAGDRNSFCEESQYSRMCGLGVQVLENCRNELYRLFPFLDGAFASVAYQPSRETMSIGTDGELFLFCPEFVLECFGSSPERMCRGYLHMLLHCLYFHPFPEKKYEERQWNLACDLAAEQIIGKNVCKGALEAGSSGSRDGAEEAGQAKVRQACLDFLGEEIRSAQTIYAMVEDGEFPWKTEELEEAFRFDDHALWKGISPGQAARLRKKWEKLLLYSREGRESKRRRAGTRAGSRKEELDAFYRSRYDYRGFLRRFCVSREEVELDTESFDYIFYTYGMEHYGNIPFVEPLEYQEVNRLEELVIAIDTSGSCSRGLVQRFLGETYKILSTRENFFRKMKVYLIQCDCNIQSVAVIHSEEEWKEYSQCIRIEGRGGTDFRPVFRYIQSLQEKRLLKNLKALIYFTDGDGVYPQGKPEYETAFVFVKRTDSMKLAPPWALCLLTDEGMGTKEQGQYEY